MNDNTENLFSISQAAKACNISRSTLIRLENRGLLTPAYTSPKSGRRYYDNNNITRVLEIQKFQAMGFNTEETIPYFSENGNAKELLSILEKKLSVLQDSISEMRLRAHDVPAMEVQMTELPETVCCVRRCTGLSVKDKYDAMYDFFHECVKNGYVLSCQPLFVIRDYTDYLEGITPSTPYDFQVCVPVLPEYAPENAVRFNVCNALSLLYYGNYSKVEEAFIRLGSEVRKRGLTPAGSVRIIGRVAPYTGREIAPDMYCSQLVLPVT